jgi:hypothetical protein
MISSKNNALVLNDINVLNEITPESPILSNMDNYISPEARLAYSLECILFELEKNGIQRKYASEFLVRLNDVPLVSHLAIREAV